VGVVFSSRSQHTFLVDKDTTWIDKTKVTHHWIDTREEMAPMFSTDDDEIVPQDTQPYPKKREGRPTALAESREKD